MNDSLLEAAAKVFEYSATPRRRRHGPRGYLDYRSYKPWFRDEFRFRCAYCLCRERWEPNGHAVFGVDHIKPQSTHPEQAGEYDNLLYACSVCNACRRDAPLPFDPGVEAMAWHLQTLPNGTIGYLTSAGRELCDVCHLNRSPLVQFRRSLRGLLELLASRRGGKDELALRRILSFPEDLPDLRAMRPPGRNNRPEALSSCHFEQRKRGELSAAY